jgi:hypothetical protein
MGFQAVLVVLKNDTHLAAVESLVDEKCVVWAGHDWSVLGTATPTFRDQACCGFIDGRDTREIISQAGSMLLTKLTSTQRARSKFEGWNTHTIKVDHHIVGRVTD